MNINIAVERENGKLELESFSFHLLDHPTRLRLYEYLLFTRPSIRHKFRVTECWRPGGRRTNTLEEPPLTEDIVEHARQQLVSLFTDVPVGMK